MNMRGLWLLLFVALCGGGWVMAADLEAGLTCEVWGIDGAVEDFPTIPADKAPTVKKVDVQVNFESTEDAWPGTQLTDQFYIRWTGVVKIPKDAKYTFYTESDDGSRMFIDGKQVVDNGGLHGMEEKAGDPVELKAGDHEIKIEFFENGGGAGCKALWEAEGITKEAIPAKALFHKK
jgi:hypothetical protein